MIVAECVLGMLEHRGNETFIEPMSLYYSPVCFFLSLVGSLCGTSLLKNLFDAFDGRGAGHCSCAKINHTSRTSIKHGERCQGGHYEARL